LGTVEIRERMHPLKHPNHGSTFTWGRAARLIQQAGLVGTSIGGVKVSEKHRGFFISVQQASAQDYEALIYLIIPKVYE
ncbi:UDP-N-acetylmuramate dehydrogenase, partial [Enterococcus faecalis]